jgi:hypothetical protein
MAGTEKRAFVQGAVAQAVRGGGVVVGESGER